MTSPHNMADSGLSQQVVQIASVDPVGLTAVGYTRQKSTVNINLQYHVGSVHIIPCVGEQWILKKVSANWGLERKLSKNDNTLANVADYPVEGLTQIGSSGVGSGPTIIEGSQTTINSNRLQLGPSTLYRDNSGVLESSTDGGTTWTQIQGGGGGGPATSIAWNNITGVPTDFPTTWDDIDNIPSTFPSSWTQISGKPATYPPTLPTGTGGAGYFWSWSGDWELPPSGPGAVQLSTDNVPSGAINGTNTVFTLPQFTLGTTMVYLNGLRQKIGSDYAETNDTTITMVTAPHTLDTLVADFVVAGNALVAGEVPSGTVNGTNTTFTTANSYATATTSVFRNGLREQLNIGYTESGGNAIVFSTPPLSTDLVVVDYLLPA
jgi:hypothetical protein